jgi:signal transduction histidine kinase
MKRGVIAGLLLVGMFLAWTYPRLMLTPDELATEAATYLEDRLPSLHKAATSWKVGDGEPPAGFEYVALDSKGQRESWSGRGLLTADDKNLGALRGFHAVDVQNGQGLVWVTPSTSGTQILFYRLTYRYSLTSSSLYDGLQWPGVGGNLLTLHTTTNTLSGHEVRWQGKVIFRVATKKTSPVTHPGYRAWFNRGMVLWLFLWALLWIPLVPQGDSWSKRWMWSSWLLGLVSGLWWLYRGPFELAGFFGMHTTSFGLAWSQAVLAFVALWVFPMASRYSLFWRGPGRILFSYILLVCTLQDGQSKWGWADPLGWSLDDTARLLLILGLVSFLVPGHAHSTGIRTPSPYRAWTLPLALILVALGWFWQDWDEWALFLGLGGLFWAALGWALDRPARSTISRAGTYGLVGGLMAVLCYGQHVKVGLDQARSRLEALVQARPIEAYTYLMPWIDALRSDSTLVNSGNAGYVRSESGLQSLLDRHSRSLRLFFDFQTFDFQAARDSVLAPDLEGGLQWKGSVQEQPEGGRSAYRVRVALGSLGSVPDTLSVKLYQKFFPSLSPIPALLGKVTGAGTGGASWGTGLALYQDRVLVYQDGWSSYPYRVPDYWFRAVNNEETSKVVWNGGQPLLVYRNSSGQWAVQALIWPSLVLPIAFGALVWLLLGWMERWEKLGRLDRWSFWFRVGTWGELRFQTKVQWASTALVFGVIAMLVAFTTWFITRRFDREAESAKWSQMNQFYRVAQNILNQDPGLSEANVRSLREWASVNDLDFYIYDNKGRFQGGSRSLWFDQKLLSDWMPFEVWQSLQRGDSPYRSVEERLDRLDFGMAYQAVRGSDGELLAVLALPFLSQTDRAGLSEYLAAVFSFFILVTLLAVFLAYRLAIGVAAPLHNLTKAMLQTKSGLKSTINEEQGRGELGLLLKSYNQMVQSLTENEAKLALAERNTAWKEMARNIAHDIKNPLTPMKLRVQKMLRDKAQNPDVFIQKFEVDAGLILRQIDFLTEIADTYREFAKEKEPNKEVFVWTDALDEVVSWYRDQMELHWVARWEEAQRPLVLGNKSRLQRVIQNLFQNASQAYPANESVRLDVRVTLEKGWIATRIRDYGTGIDPEWQGRIFEVSFSTRSHGMGLGLSMARQIAELHGGTLDLEFSDEKGTGMLLRLPLHLENSEPNFS